MMLAACAPVDLLSVRWRTHKRSADRKRHLLKECEYGRSNAGPGLGRLMLPTEQTSICKHFKIAPAASNCIDCPLGAKRQARTFSEKGYVKSNESGIERPVQIRAVRGVARQTCRGTDGPRTDLRSGQGEGTRCRKP